MIKLIDSTIDINSLPEFKDKAVLKYINQQWEMYHNYADTDFVREFRIAIEEIATNPLIYQDDIPVVTTQRDLAFQKFLQRYWEMRCSTALLQTGCTLLPSEKQGSKGPDIILEDGNKRIWIECICPTKGVGTNEVPQISVIPKKVFSGYVPLPEITLRLASSIRTKRDKFYTSYLDQSPELVGDNDPCIIAVNGCNIYDTDHDFEQLPPAIANCVYGLGPLSVCFGDNQSHSFITRREKIQREGKSDIENNVFELSDFKHISAVLYWYTDPWNQHRDQSPPFLVVNTNACNPLPDSFLSMFNHWIADDYIRYVENGTEKYAYNLSHPIRRLHA